MQQGVTRVPQGFVLSTGVRTKAGVQGKGRGKKTSAPSLCAPAFLTAPIRSIRPTSKETADRLEIDIDKSYVNVQASVKRFFRFAGLNFDFKPSSGLTKAQQLGEMIDYVEEALKPLGLSLVVSKKDSQGGDVDVLEVVVYRWGAELEDTIVILYCSPAWYLSPEGSQMYKRFMKFVTDSTGIPLGVPDHTENFYLDCIVNYDEAFFDEEEEEQANDTITKYRQDGEFWNLFDEIHGLPREKPKDLYEALEEYRHQCPVDETELVEAMMEGIDVIKDANYYWFEFNPDDDGISNEYGFDSADGYASSVFASAILFSEQDGISEQLLDTVNNEVNAGIMMTGWNIHQWLYPDTKKADILEFMRCKDLVASLDKWLRVFYRATEKFDKYGKSEQDSE